MASENLLSRFNTYQKERFPFAVLIFTTLSVVLSSAAMVIPQHSSWLDLVRPIIVGTITCLLFMFSIRVFDDCKDVTFDDQYYKNRPIQRGLISLHQLQTFNAFAIGVQILINMIVSLHAFLYWLVAMAYSLIAKAEFFAKHRIRKNFMLYNFVNLMQLFFLQIYLYVLIQPALDLKNSLLYIHFLFVLVNAVILEIARKLKSKSDESRGLDTYSGRYGAKNASLFYAGSYGITFVLFLVIIMLLGLSWLVVSISSVLLMIMLGATFYYYKKQSLASTQVLQGSAIIFYLSMHILLVVTVFV